MKKEVYKAIKISALSANEKQALIGLVSFHLDDKTIFASHKWMGKNWGMSGRTVQRAIKYFEDKLQIIEVVRRDGMSNIISFVVEMEDLIELLGQIKKSKPYSSEDEVGKSDRSRLQNDMGGGQDVVRDGQNGTGPLDKMSTNIEDNLEKKERSNIETIDNNINNATKDNVGIGDEI